MTDAHDAQENPLANAAAPPPADRARTRGHVRSFGADRLCSDATCTTVLSRYNESGACWVHSSDNQGSARRP